MIRGQDYGKHYILFQVLAKLDLFDKYRETSYDDEDSYWQTFYSC